MNNYIHLQKFKKEELIFDVEETKIILRFIFKSRHNLIDNLEINDRVREFAQGLLLEEIDASYAFGFVDMLFRAPMNPGASAKQILTKFGKKALKHWFKHATTKDLTQIKIYDRVRERLAENFGRILIMYSNGTAMESISNAGFVAYDNSSKSHAVWG